MSVINYRKLVIEMQTNSYGNIRLMNRKRIFTQKYQFLKYMSHENYDC
jgi:hypothetical protein